MHAGRLATFMIVLGSGCTTVAPRQGPAPHNETPVAPVAKNMDNAAPCQELPTPKTTPQVSTSTGERPRFFDRSPERITTRSTPLDKLDMDLREASASDLSPGLQDGPLGVKLLYMGKPLPSFVEDLTLERGDWVQHTRRAASGQALPPWVAATQDTFLAGLQSPRNGDAIEFKVVRHGNWVFIACAATQSTIECSSRHDDPDPTCVVGTPAKRGDAIAFRVSLISASCPAYALGIREGDLITSINDRAFVSADNLSEVLLRIRDENIGFVTLALERDGVSHRCRYEEARSPQPQTP